MNIVRKFLLPILMALSLGTGVGAAIWFSGSENVGSTRTPDDGQKAAPAPNSGGGRDVAWGEFTRDEGTIKALQFLVEEAEKDPNFASACHTAAHEIGQATAGNISLREALDLEPEKCLNGYTHGLLQVLAAEPTTVFSDLLDACAAAKGGKMATECVHGAGHLLALRHPASLGSSLEECLMLEKSLQDWCVGGVMMEYGQNYLAKRWPAEYSEISRTMGPDKPTPINLTLEETESPCQIDPRVAAMYQCWTEMGPFIIANVDSLENIGAMSEKCRHPEERPQWGCLYSLFAWLTDNLDTGGDDPEVLAQIAESLCEAVEADLLEGCLNGALYRLGLPRDIQAVEALCPRWTGSWLDGCLQGVETARISHRNAGIDE